MAGRRERDEGADLELLKKLLDRRGNADWNAFYRRYERLIIGCLRKVLTRYGVPCAPEELDDLVSTICLQLVRDDYDKLRRFDPSRGYRLSSWVGLIATNVAYDALRRRGPPTLSIEDDTAGVMELAADNPSPVEQVTVNEQLEALNRAVQRLSPAEQLFLRYCYQEQRSPEEIAALLGISINTVYSRKNKVRTTLKRIVAEMDLE